MLALSGAMLSGPTHAGSATRAPGDAPDYAPVLGATRAALPGAVSGPDAIALPPLPTLPPLTLTDFPLPENAAERQRLRQVCGLIEREARRVGMPPAFFARLINTESRFDIHAVSPVGAQGVAQFMPGTASDRGLLDPFDPVRAIPASADYLADLRRLLGNWGLAAAGYNAGPGGALRFVRGGTLPGETRRYVRAITGRAVVHFKTRSNEVGDEPLAKGLPFVEACMALPTLRRWPVLPDLDAPLAASGRGLAPILAAAASPVTVPTADVAPRAPMGTARGASAGPEAPSPRGPASAAPPSEPLAAPESLAEPLSTPLAAPAPVMRPAVAALVVADPADISVTAAERAAVTPPFPAILPSAPRPGVDGRERVAPEFAAYPALPTLAPLLSLDFPLPESVGKERRTRQICGLIEREARRVGMAPSFFARLINKESRFDPGAVSPVGAQGVAQFMPYTARERGLRDPFEPVQAIPASADYLAELRDQLGNWGLAAAGYNAGPGRVIDFFGGRRLPLETRDYVLSITGRPATHFKTVTNEVEPRPLDAKLPFMEACVKLPTMRFKRPKLPGVADEVPWQPWGVQLSASFVRASAVQSFERQVKRYGKATAGARPLVVKSRVPGLKRSKYAARIGAPSRAAADKICARIRAARGRCVVIKNKR